MNARKVIVATFVLGLTFFLGAGEASAQFRPATPRYNFNFNQPSGFNGYSQPAQTNWRWEINMIQLRNSMDLMEQRQRQLQYVPPPQNGYYIPRPVRR